MTVRPPQCDVCGADASNEDGGLVTFAPLASDVEWHERANRGEVVGHPPNVAWVCGLHIDEARSLAPTHGLRPALERLRRTFAAESVEKTGDRPGIVPIEIGALERRLRDLFAEVAASVGLGHAPVSKTEDRRWTPMDGAEPPDCPFTDISVREASDGSRHLTLTFERAHWNPHEIARASLTLAAHGHGADVNFRVSASTPDSGSLKVDSLATKGAVPEPLTALVKELCQT